jgi:hypothetical protein
LDTVSVDTGEAQQAALVQLIKRRAIQQEARTIWTSLTPTEQHVLRAVAGHTGYESNAETEQAVAMLVQKRLLRVDRDEQKLYIQPPLFELFVKADPQKTA